MRRLVGGALASVLGCQGTSGGVVPDAGEYDAASDPCGDGGEWATRPVRAIASHDRYVQSIVADETDAYWTELLTCADAACFPGAIVLRAPLTGGDPEPLFERGEEQEQPGALAVTREHLFVSIGADLWRTPKEGMAPEVVGAAVSSLAADPDAVYFVEAGELVRLAADTLERTTLGEAPGGEFEVVGGAAWFLAREPAAIWRIKLPEGGPAELAAQMDQAAASELAVARSDLAFLATWNPLEPDTPTFLTRIGLDDGSSEPQVDLDGIFVVEADETHVYWMEPNRRRLSRMPVDGGCVESREHDQASMAIAASAVGILVASAGNIAVIAR